MPYLLLGVALLGLLLLTARWLVNTDAAKLGRFVGWFLIGIGGAAIAAFLFLLLVSDRFGLALMGGGGLAFAVSRWRSVMRPRFAGATGGSRQSFVETKMLRMRLDHATGVISGDVRTGPFAGRSLEGLKDGELLSLWRHCTMDDDQGARLLETYLDRLKPDWRSWRGENAQRGENMTLEQAYAILELRPGADPDQIKEAHRRLMMKLHPDHGGSTYLAAQINRAKDMLLGA